MLDENKTRREALEIMQKHTIDHLPIVNAAGRVVDLVERRGIDDQILLSTPHMGEAERDFVDEAFRTNWIAPLGPNVDAFESELAEMVGTKHAVALSSGTAAIHLALLLLDIGPGDVVFCSSLTFAASVNPIIYQGGEPVLIDSEPESWNMSPGALERALETARKKGRLPKAVIVVNLYGQSADMDPIGAICERYDVPIVEDAAKSLVPSTVASTRVHSGGSVSIRSTATRSSPPQAEACWSPRKRRSPIVRAFLRRRPAIRRRITSTAPSATTIE